MEPSRTKALKGGGGGERELRNTLLGTFQNKSFQRGGGGGRVRVGGGGEEGREFRNTLLGTFQNKSFQRCVYGGRKREFRNTLLGTFQNKSLHTLLSYKCPPSRCIPCRAPRRSPLSLVQAGNQLQSRVRTVDNVC